MPIDRWEDGQDEQVEVNQRALIDKVLARYAAEFTVFRELLQNSDDARAHSVEIRFETKAYLEREEAPAQTAPAFLDPSAGPSGAEPAKERLPNLKTTHVHRWTFKNDGIVFREEDWNRLKKIADGNPDEDKIGAFGVGFYSLFSVTEEPRVMSGDKGMRFYFKDGGDQLLVRRRTLDPSEASAWTTFEMRLREPGPIPNASDFTRFLAASLTFMAHLSAVAVWLDGHRLARITKRPGAPRALPLPRALKPASPGGIMLVKSLQSTPLHITAEVMQWVHTVATEKPAVVLPRAIQPQSAQRGGLFGSFWSALSGAATPQRATTPVPRAAAAPAEAEADPRKVVESAVALAIFAADVEVRVDRKMAGELDRSTKKKPPARLKYELIYTGKSEYDASKEDDEKQPANTGSVFQGLRADLDGTGAARIFIGHATNQTTGLGGHMSSRFIPTVERESIDLVDRHVAVWNKELLFVGGYLARAAYEMEMANIRDLWAGAVVPGPSSTSMPPAETQEWLQKRSLHALKFFTFHTSTPSPVVSSDLEKWFFACGHAGASAFPVFSSAGVRPASEVRIPDAKFSSFLKNLPMLPESNLTDANIMVQALQREGLIRQITLQDILAELRARPLDADEAVACLRWWVAEAPKHAANPQLPRLRAELLGATVLSLGAPGTAAERIVPLSAVRTFVNARRIPGALLIPLGGPLPPDVLPQVVADKFREDELRDALAWSELSVLEWLRYITGPPVTAHDPAHDVARSQEWAERVLLVLAKVWANLSREQQGEAVAMLQDKTCVPTTAGLKLPADAYFPNVNLFPDLPILTTSLKGNALEKVFHALGVRKHVELQIVFNRMMKTGDWAASDLVKYLTSVQGTLTEDEWNKLRQTRSFLAEGQTDPQGQLGKAPRHTAGQLYEPSPALRDLGLPILDWGTTVKWRGTSEEAKFLFKIGLQRIPTLDVIIRLAAGSDIPVREKALHYLLDNFHKQYSAYNAQDFANIAFIPALDGNEVRLAKPNEVFTNSDWALLGFAVVQPTLRQDDMTSKLNIREHPPTAQLVSLLERQPPKDHETAQQWFSVLAGRIAQFTDAELRTLARMPIVPVKSSPGEKTTRMLPPHQCYFLKESKGQIHSQLFVSVDFGPRANSFLSACGTKDEPSVEEIATILLNNPRHFYELAKGRDHYLIELRNISVNQRLLSSALLTRMKRTPFLLASRRVKKGEGFADIDDENAEHVYDLLRADQIIVADDTNEYQLFGDAIFCCPQEDLLEGFYTQLGSRRLSSLVKEEYRTSNEVKTSRVASDIRALVLQRLPLFLHDHTHDGQRLTYAWLNQENHFVVKTFGKVSVAKTLKFGNILESRSSEASAVAKQEGYSYGKGSVQLWISGYTQVDMFEVANSLCRLLFETPKKNDALLFSAILSTDLSSLRRRGYNVERILRQQRAERQAAEEASRQARPQSTALVSDADPAVTIPGQFETPPAVPIASKPTSALTAMHAGADSRPATPEPTLVNELVHEDKDGKRSRPKSAMMHSIKELGRKFTRNESGAGGALVPSLPGGSPQTPNPSGHVTPLTNISRNIENAIQACRPETRGLLHNREQMQTVKESLNEGYCDVSGQAGDLRHVGNMGGIKLFVAPDVPDAASVIATKQATTARFIHIIQRLGEVYKLPPTSLHVFYDAKGSLIAFNSSGSLFCNLRYYEAWHDAEVQKGKFDNAYISWFFTLAHEIAHNLVQPHNSEHEFYFSAICEAHLLSFGKLLAGPGS